MIRSGELHVMKEIAKKEPEKNPGFDTFQKLTYLYNCVNSQSSPLVPPWWSKASCRIWHLINVFDYEAMPFSDSESLSLIFDTIVIKFSKIKKNRPRRETNDYNSLWKVLFTTMTNQNLVYDIKVNMWSSKVSCDERNCPHHHSFCSLIWPLNVLERKRGYQ